MPDMTTTEARLEKTVSDKPESVFRMRPRRRRAGLSPGSLVYAGKEKQHAISVTCWRYSETSCIRTELTDLENLPLPDDQEPYSWFHVSGVHDADALRRLGDHFGIHPLTLEDIMSLDQRPKLEEYEKYLCIMLRSVLDSGGNLSGSQQVTILLGKNYVLTFQDEEGNAFEAVAARLEKGVGRIRSRGMDYLAYALADNVVDHILVAIEAMEERVDELEEDIFSQSLGEVTQPLYEVRQDIAALRKVVMPAREVVGRLDHLSTDVFSAETRPFLRDIFDHCMRAQEEIDALRDVVSNLFDLSLSISSQKTNQVMQTLTVLAAIFIPLSFLASLYGMNFVDMPELHWRWGYRAIQLLMICIAAGLLYFFHRKRWI